MKPRQVHLFVLAAAALLALAWPLLRGALEERLAVAAQRDLHTIVDLVAADIEDAARAAPGLAGAALATAATRADASLASVLRRASDEHRRGIYFFDRRGTVVAPGHAATDRPRIVAAALAELERTAATQGVLAEPYPDHAGTEAIGVWRWLPGAEIGIVAERPYRRFAQPLAWLDGLFAMLLALLVGGAFLAGLPGIGALRAAFRRADIERCGPYRVERLIGAGAMSNVYLARHAHLGRVVALKRLKLQAASDEFVARFDREARLASRLAHPNIVAIHDHGRAPDGGFYYAMEYVHGLTLTQWVQQHGPLPPARAIRVLRQVAAAVGAMHRAGLLHRDIKPDNIMAHAAHGDWDLVKLLDFGLVKQVDGDASRDLTRDVRVLGTPAFMAPERLADPRGIDPRTDLYGIGAVGFYLLTGRKPFEATLDRDLAQQVLHVPAPPVASLSPFALPAQLAALIDALLAKEMDHRPASAEILAAALAELGRVEPWRPELARLWWQSVFPAVAEDAAAAQVDCQTQPPAA
jgi:tRNA A-37 threonylcarbamoyl transferase component Bud32